MVPRDRNAQARLRFYLTPSRFRTGHPEVSKVPEGHRGGLGVVPTNFTTHGPKTVPRVDYDRIFVLDEDAKLLGEYALRDDCPLEYDDLRRAIPLSGMRHLLSFYQGEYVFTPFRVGALWFVLLTQGVPRIEERGSIGTLLAAMRVHLPPSLSPTLAAREAALRDRERELDARETVVSRKEQRVDQLEEELALATKKMEDLAAEVRARESRLNALRDYAMEIHRTFQQTESSAGRPAIAERDSPEDRAPPPRSLIARPSHDR